MTDIEIRIDFDDTLRMLTASAAAADQVVAGAAELLRSNIVAGIQRRSPTSGPETRYNPRRTAYPAQEGFPPNTDTGHLAASVQRERTGEAEQRVYVGADYGEALEFDGHPFVGPEADAIAGMLPQLATAILEALDR